jgi:hypothetical protein
MKKSLIYFIFSGLAFASLLSSCEDKDREKNNPISAPSLRFDTVGAVKTGTFTVYGNITNSGNLFIQGKGILYSDTAAVPSFRHVVKTATSEGAGSFNGVATGLKPLTVYKFRLFARNYVDTTYSEVFEYKSAPLTAKVSAGVLSSVDRTSVMVSSTLTDNSGETILDRGFVVGTAANPQINTRFGDYNFVSVSSDSTENTYTTTIQNLTPAKRYFIRPYVRNRGGIGYGAQIDVTTLP